VVAVSTYRVLARRTGEWWALEVPDLPGVFSQAKRLDQADEAAREAIAVMLDVEPEEISVEVEAELSPDVQDALAAVRLAQEEARKAVEREREAMQEAAVLLTKRLSQRDAGRFLGVSFQRIHQLLKGYRPATARQDVPTQTKKAAGRSKSGARSKSAGRTKTAA
jgi:predicted RNase H-like HicB family nuclease